MGEEWMNKWINEWMNHKLLPFQFYLQSDCISGIKAVSIRYTQGTHILWCGKKSCEENQAGRRLLVFMVIFCNQWEQWQFLLWDSQYHWRLKQREQYPKPTQYYLQEREQCLSRSMLRFTSEAHSFRSSG